MARLLFRTDCIYFLAALLFGATTEAFGHSGDIEKLGMYHAFGRVEHVFAFLGIGTLAAFLMLMRKRYSIILANSALIIALLSGTIPHGLDRSMLFGLEFFLGTAFISLIAWRAIYWLYTFVVARFENHKRHSQAMSSRFKLLKTSSAERISARQRI